MSSWDSKNELGAIFRLEFYKNQKNWKLSTKRNDKKCHKKQVEKKEKKPNLNTTYCVKRGAEVSDQLNVAFVEAESACLEPVNIRPLEIDSENNYGTPNTNQNIRGEFLKHVGKSPTCDDTGGTTTGRKTAMERIEELLKLNCYEEEQNNLMKETDWRDSEGYFCTNYDEKWPLRSALLLSAGHMAREVGDTEAEASYAVGGDCPEDLAYSGPWIQPSTRPDLPPEFKQAMEDSFNMAVDSSGEFCRGADAATHSSEIDFTMPPPPVDIEDVSFAYLSRLSSQLLLRAAELHSCVLRKMLMENEQRQWLRESARKAGGWDEPTRDFGPDLPLAPSPGRGRGRLSRPDLWG